jgi:hypothetical protein
MSITFYDILNKNIKSKKRLYFYECYNRQFFRLHHIGMQSKFKLIQSGGYNYEYKKNNISYTVELFENEYDKTDSDYEYINKYIYVYKTEENIKEPYCSFGSLVFNQTEPGRLHSSLPCCVLSYYNNETFFIFSKKI